MSTLFLLPESRLAKSPSAQDKLSPEDEYDIRVLGCELIQSSGLLLDLPQTAMATAQVLFHRFYYSKSFVRYPMQHTAMACVALASKIEESPKRIRDVVKAFHKLSFMRKHVKPPEFQINERYASLKNEVVRAERRILKELGFYVYVNHPHKFIVTLLQILECTDNQNFVQTAWSYMNDGLRTDVFLRYSAETIACSCVYLSARILDIPLPEEPAWWEVFLVTEEDIRNVCKIILKLYTRPKPDQERLEEVIAKLAKELESTRKKPSIISQLGSKSIDPPVSSHPKRVKVEHIIQVPDGKRQLNSTIEVKEIKELKEDDRRRWKSQERNRSGSPGQPQKRSRSRSRSRENSRRKYTSKEYRDDYGDYSRSKDYADYPPSSDYTSRDYAGRDYADRGYGDRYAERDYTSRDYESRDYDNRDYDSRKSYSSSKDPYREHSSKDYDRNDRHNGRYNGSKYGDGKYAERKDRNDKYAEKNDRNDKYADRYYRNDRYVEDEYDNDYYRRSGREKSSKSRHNGGR